MSTVTTVCVNKFDIASKPFLNISPNKGNQEQVSKTVNTSSEGDKRFQFLVTLCGK